MPDRRPPGPAVFVVGVPVLVVGEPMLVPMVVLGVVVLGGVRVVVREEADQIDDALEADSAGRRALVLFACS